MDYQDVRRKKQELAELAEQNESEAIKRKISSEIERRFKTTMIGALSDLEKDFGCYWGHGKERDELSEEELEDRDRWERARNSILDRGNKEMRNLLNEISELSFKKRQYKVNYKFE